MKICMITLSTPEIECYAQYTRKIKQEYCVKRGYHFAELKCTIDPSRPPSWSKILLLQRHLVVPCYDWIWWLDADAVPRDINFGVEGLVQGTDLHIVTDWSDHLELGSILIRDSLFTEKLLKDTWNETSEINHPWWEQKAMMSVIEKQNLEYRFSQLGMREYIVHLAGKTTKERFEFFKTYKMEG